MLSSILGHCRDFSRLNICQVRGNNVAPLSHIVVTILKWFGGILGHCCELFFGAILGHSGLLSLPSRFSKCHCTGVSEQITAMAQQPQHIHRARPFGPISPAMFG